MELHNCPLDNICAHNVQAPTTFFRRVFGSRLLTAVHIHVATFRVIRDRRARCFCGAVAARTAAKASEHLAPKKAHSWISQLAHDQ